MTEHDENRRFEFRHDRILEHHLTLAASEMLRQGGNGRECLQDPFFIPVVGRAVGCFPLPGPVLEWISEKIPNSLVAAIPHLPAPLSDYADNVVAGAREWLVNAETVPESARVDAFWTLAATKSPYVLEVTDGVEEHVLLLEARLRNGDAVAGAKALSREFYPAIHHTWLEDLIEQAHTHHGPELVEKLCALMTADNLDDRLRDGAFCLAGYLGESSLAGAIKVAWENAPDQLEIILPALWAGLRCADDEPSGVLGPMMQAILQLPGDQSGGSLSSRGSMLRELGITTRHAISEPVLRYLADLGTAEQAYRWIVTTLLDDVDHPVAVGYVARELADIIHRAEQAGSFSPLAMRWGDRWQASDKHTRERLSAASISTLRSLWEDENHPDWLHKYAFSVWRRCVDNLGELQSIPTDSPHFESAAWERALRGDQEIVPYVLGKLSVNQRWFHVVPPIWSQEFVSTVDAALTALVTKSGPGASPWSNAPYDFRYLLRDIPTDAAEPLLVKHWGDLGREPPSIQIALYHGTERCRALAAESLGTIGLGGEPLQHIGSFFGFFTRGLQDQLTVRHLETLRPYLSRLDDFCLTEMVEFCRRYDHWDWALQHLRPECRRRVQTIKPDLVGNPPYIARITVRWFPSDEELLANLDEIEKGDPRHYGGYIWAWWGHFIERRDSPTRPSRLLEQWLQRSPSFTRFKVVARALRDRGTRQDLAMLRNCNLDPKPTEAQAILDNVEFVVMRRSLD